MIDSNSAKSFYMPIHLGSLIEYVTSDEFRNLYELCDGGNNGDFKFDKFCNTNNVECRVDNLCVFYLCVNYHCHLVISRWNTKLFCPQNTKHATQNLSVLTSKLSLSRRLYTVLFCNDSFVVEMHFCVESLVFC